MKVALLYEFREIEKTPIYILTAVVRLRRNGKFISGVFHFLIPAVWDIRDAYSPDLSEKIYSLEEEEYYVSVQDFLRQKYRVPFDRTKLLKIKEIVKEN
jgi:hypothetical protein